MFFNLFCFVLYNENNQSYNKTNKIKKIGSTWEGGMHVPAIIKWKGKIPEMSVCQSTIFNMDFLPTFCEMLNIELPNNKTYDGTNVLNYFLQPSKYCNDVTHANDAHQYVHYWRESILYAVRYRQYKGMFYVFFSFFSQCPIFKETK